MEDNESDILESLIDRHYSLVYRCIPPRLYDKRDREEVVMDVFIDVWRSAKRNAIKLSDLLEEPGLLVYLSRRFAIQRLRYINAQCRQDIPVECFATAHTVAQPHEYTYLIKESLNGALSKLTKREKDILVHYYYFKFTSKELGEIYGLHEVSVRKIAKYGREKFVEEYNGRYRD